MAIDECDRSLVETDLGPDVGRRLTGEPRAHTGLALASDGCSFADVSSQRVACSVLLFLVSAASTVVAAIAFEAAISTGYDPHENRAPAVRDAIAAMWLLVSVALLLSSAIKLRTRQPSHAPVLALTAIFLMFAYGIVSLSTGPL